MIQVRKLVGTLLLVLGVSRAGSAQTEVTGIDVYPPDINLQSKVDHQSYLVMAKRKDGVTQDITQQATASLANAALAKLEKNVLLPVADGETMLNVEFQGFKASVPVRVKEATADRAISFHLDVMPIFARSGCNTGSCHGAARGKDGFRLSLFGFDPKGDYYRLTREIGFRRVNLAVPQDSLLIEKSIGAVPHSGGKRFDLSSEYGKTLMGWLQAGCATRSRRTASCFEVGDFSPAAESKVLIRRSSLSLAPFTQMAMIGM